MRGQHTERGQVAQVGFVLFFATLVILFSIYQALIIPQENKQIEFRHYERVSEDLQQLRNAIVAVGETNDPQTIRLELGATYPDRLFFVDEPAPAGTLRAETIGTGAISINGFNTSALCGIGDETTTKALSYSPNYNHLTTADSLTYENTVLYRQTDDGELLIDGGQAIVREKTINLVPLVTNLSTSRSSATEFTFRGAKSGTTTVTKSLTLTIPTRLSVDAWENRSELLADEPQVSDISRNQSQPNAIDVKLKPATYDLRCTAVSEGRTPNVNIGLEEDRDEINPAGAGDIRLEEELRGQNQDSNVITLRLNNSYPIDLKAETARINFYYDYSVGGSAPDYAEIAAAGGSTSATLEFRSNFKTLSPKITLAGNGTKTDIELTFYAKSGKDASLDSKDWFVITIRYSNGESGLYFIPIPK